MTAPASEPTPAPGPALATEPEPEPALVPPLAPSDDDAALREAVADSDPDAEPEPEPEPEPKPEVLRPPRVSGVYLGGAIWGGATVGNTLIPLDPTGGGGGAVRLGQVLLPWLSLGVEGSGGFYFNDDQLFMKGGVFVDFGFYPIPDRYPLSLHAGFGFGAGLLLDDRTDERGGVGGPRFMAAARYEFFPGAARRRPKKPGGFVIGPELGWRAFQGADKDLPRSHTFLLGVWFGHYWGR